MSRCRHPITELRLVEGGSICLACQRESEERRHSGLPLLLFFIAFTAFVLGVAARSWLGGAP